MRRTALRPTPALAARGLAAACALALSIPARAQVSGQEVEELEGVGVVQHLEALLPLDAAFVDETGDDTTLGESFADGKPVLLTLNYVDCPQLCNVHLATLVQALKEVDLAIGDDYRVVTVSIHPDDTPEKAAGMRDEFLRKLLGAEAADAPEGAWRFLVGEEVAIGRVAETVGYQYRWLPDRQEYAHPATTVVVTPEGRVARYLEGIRPDPGVVRLSLVEASEGKIGTLFDGIFLSCFMYDAGANSYVPSAFKIMRIGGALVLLMLVTGIVYLRRGEVRRERERAAEAQ